MIIDRDVYNLVMCPVARTFIEDEDFAPYGDKRSTCRGPACAAFRWIPLKVDAAFREALHEVLNRKDPDTDKPYSHKKAAAYVHENRPEFGLPTEPEQGFCGLGPAPEVI